MHIAQARCFHVLDTEECPKHYTWSGIVSQPNVVVTEDGWSGPFICGTSFVPEMFFVTNNHNIYKLWQLLVLRKWVRFDIICCAKISANQFYVHCLPCRLQCNDVGLLHDR